MKKRQEHKSSQINGHHLEDIKASAEYSMNDGSESFTGDLEAAYLACASRLRPEIAREQELRHRADVLNVELNRRIKTLEDQLAESERQRRRILKRLSIT